MTGQGYSARSEPNYRNWALGILLLVALAASAWYAFTTSSEPPPSVAALTTSSEPAGYGSKKEIQERLVLTAKALDREKERTRALRTVLGEAGGQIRRLGGEVASYRRALESQGQGAYAAQRPPSAIVRQLGEPILTPGAKEWYLAGDWINLGDAPAVGYADLQLEIDGVAVGDAQSLRIGPIEPGAISGYTATLKGPAAKKGQTVRVRFGWRSL